MCLLTCDAQYCGVSRPHFQGYAYQPQRLLSKHCCTDAAEWRQVGLHGDGSTRCQHSHSTQCYAEEATKAWHRQGTQQHKEHRHSTQTTVKRHNSHTQHRAPSKNEPTSHVA